MKRDTTFDKQLGTWNKFEAILNPAEKSEIVQIIGARIIQDNIVFKFFEITVEGFI